MIGLDTNVVVRYLVQDEPAQSAAASALMDGFTEREGGFLSVVAVVEIYWVLSRAYRVPTRDCTDAIAGLLTAGEIRVDRADLVRAAIDKSDAGADFADALIAAIGHEAHCAETVTFDRGAAKAGLMRLLGT